MLDFLPIPGWASLITVAIKKRVIRLNSFDIRSKIGGNPKTLRAPIPQNGQTQSQNSSAKVDKLSECV